MSLLHSVIVLKVSGFFSRSHCHVGVRTDSLLFVMRLPFVFIAPLARLECSAQCSTARCGGWSHLALRPAPSFPVRGEERWFSEMPLIGSVKEIASHSLFLFFIMNEVEFCCVSFTHHWDGRIFYLNDALIDMQMLNQICTNFPNKKLHAWDYYLNFYMSLSFIC